MDSTAPLPIDGLSNLKAVKNERAVTIQSPSFTESPLAIFFYALAVISATSGLLLALAFWPKNLENIMGLSDISYLIAVSILAGGLVQAAIFVAIGKCLSYLRQVMINTSRI